MKTSFKALALAIAMAVPGMAQAVTVWTIERTSDTTASITMTGTIDEATSTALSFVGASATNGGSGVDAPGGDLMLGGVGVDVTFVRFTSTVFEIRFDDLWSAGATATGTLLATLNDETWAAIGTSGNVTNGIDGGGNVVGTYTIVDPGGVVPLPAGLPLLLTGLGCLGLMRRKRS